MTQSAFASALKVTAAADLQSKTPLNIPLQSPSAKFTDQKQIAQNKLSLNTQKSADPQENTEQHSSLSQQPVKAAADNSTAAVTIAKPTAQTQNSTKNKEFSSGSPAKESQTVLPAQRTNPNKQVIDQPVHENPQVIAKPAAPTSKQTAIAIDAPTEIKSLVKLTSVQQNLRQQQPILNSIGDTNQDVQLMIRTEIPRIQMLIKANIFIVVGIIMVLLLVFIGRKLYRRHQKQKEDKHEETEFVEVDSVRTNYGQVLN